MHQCGLNAQAVRRTDDGLVNLTDLWKAAGKPEDKDPSTWARFVGSDFISYAEANSVDSRVWFAKRGNGGGNFSTREIAIAHQARQGLAGVDCSPVGY